MWQLPVGLELGRKELTVPMTEAKSLNNFAKKFFNHAYNEKTPYQPDPVHP
jgi:hypothetical protein